MQTVFSALCGVCARFLLGFLNGVSVVSKTLVSEVCGSEHETVGMGVVTSECSRDVVLVKHSRHPHTESVHRCRMS